ncbi:hypothetical protein A2630_03335 [Candidatus Woesebacteria bacterium RIFCSPHIGHO2_01_FULL_44_10]|uniref:Type II secretion system protein GspG C-terminal domain-containing protein n=1 Tax=Candidatus Woesebacteria bacterium RIFCSPLOWO2_01_FULL_44_14 TaxID=1802525 RepID=A0A1F8BZR3_9BACT|nr:MAG: hypothetical protein A2630_03335 [Candidatus Woesebacteria bacterium RIFCSPHIGHO2_01_FULL_44_10]OGM68845.1 MAG: hypothetical protein A2975_00540 [Candidatus Woesebacteria bacterium RIFCSPLOWO2_01_FULL_44_14]
MRNKGFTLIELLVVIALIGVLSTLLLSNFNAARQRGRDAQRKSDLRSVGTALRLFYNDTGAYPASTSDGRIQGVDWGQAWTVGTTNYMSALPKDPLQTQGYRYTRVDLDTYILQACLENRSDDKGRQMSVGWCPTSWVYEVRP